MPQSADKKPETYVGPDGKTKVRMVPVDREVVKSENSQLAKLKLINKIKRSGVVKTGSMSKNEAKVEEKTLTPAEVRKRDKIAKAIKKDDPNMPMDKKMAIATATAKRVAEESEQLDELTAAELKLINQMYDKKGNLTPMGKKVMAHGKAKVNEVSSKTLSNYMRKSTASAGEPGASTRTQDKRIGGQKMADDKLRKMDGKGSAAKVAATEALERDGPKKPDIFGPKGSFGKSASTTPAVQKYMAKRAAANQARNKAMDPGADKKGYGIGVTDTAKADKKAKAKGTSMMKRMGSRGKMYKAGKMM